MQSPELHSLRQRNLKPVFIPHSMFSAHSERNLKPVFISHSMFSAHSERNLKPVFISHSMFSAHSERNFKPQQLSVSLDLCLRKTRNGKSRDHRDLIVLEKLRFQNVFHPI